MNWNFRNIGIGIMFLLFAFFCLAAIIRTKPSTVYVTGVLVFAGVAVGFLKRARY